jgi:CRP-like cAMP-binding protein
MPWAQAAERCDALPPQARVRALSQPTQSYVRNCLLSAMTSGDYALLQPGLEAVILDRDMVLEEADLPIEHIFFPNRGVGSIMAVTSQGERVEAGIFGREGMSGTSIAMGTDRWPMKTLIQVAGDGYRIEAGRLRQAIEESRSLHMLLLRYGQSLAVQTAYTALANVTYPVEVRLARWLLMAHDRADGDEVTLTHDYLSVMLAVRRPSVTTALHILEGNLFIKGTRGIVTIRDRPALEEFADGSYGKPEVEYGRLIGPFFQ